MLLSTADTGWDSTRTTRTPTTVYVGESPADLSVYAAPGWDAWLAMWSLIAEWSR
jgi:hypothetical protein